MKKLYRYIAVFFVIHIVLSAVLLLLSPDVIPAHYNAAGEIDRFGSKYEYLLFPGFSLLMNVFLLALVKYLQNKNAPVMEQKLLLYTAMFTTGLLIALHLFFGIAAIRYSAEEAALSQELLLRFVNMGTGVLLILFGNVMPKARRNALFGLRTKWSMASDTVWRKSQRFAGICAVVCGFLLIVLSVVLPGDWPLTALTALILLWCSASVLASYLFWKRETGSPSQK